MISYIKKCTLFILVLTVTVYGQRPSYAGFRPIGYPEVVEETTINLGNRVGEGNATTPRIPIDALGNQQLINTISKWPQDQQPFWYLNYLQIEANRQKPYVPHVPDVQSSFQSQIKPEDIQNSLLNQTRGTNQQQTFNRQDTIQTVQQPYVNTSNPLTNQMQPERQNSFQTVSSGQNQSQFTSNFNQVSSQNAPQPNFNGAMGQSQSQSNLNNQFLSQSAQPSNFNSASTFQNQNLSELNFQNGFQNRFQQNANQQTGSQQQMSNLYPPTNGQHMYPNQFQGNHASFNGAPNRFPTNFNSQKPFQSQPLMPTWNFGRSAPYNQTG